MYKLLLIEDDQKLSSLIKECLVKYGHTVFALEEFNHIENQVISLDPDLILLDINLPYYDGFYICRSIRTKSKIPIIITSARNTELDQVMAIELGADDYIIKPFQFEVLHSKIKAALRRAYGEYSSKDEKEIRIHDFWLDEGNFRMSYGQKTVELSKNEYKLVKKFVQNKDRVLTREELFEEIWDDLTFVDDNTLTVNITRIKNKFLELGIKEIIRNRRGVGYTFNFEVLDNGQQE